MWSWLLALVLVLVCGLPFVVSWLGVQKKIRLLKGWNSPFDNLYFINVFIKEKFFCYNGKIFPPYWKFFLFCAK